MLKRRAPRGEGLLFDGGGRGRPRSDRRAFVCSVKELLFDGDGQKWTEERD